MRKTISIIGAIGRHPGVFGFLQQILEDNDVIVIPVDIDEDRGEGLNAPERIASLEAWIYGLYADHEIDGALGVGESEELAEIADALRVLPLGFPKALVSSVLAGDVTSYVETRDFLLCPSVVPSTELNDVSRRILGNAARMIVGAVKMPSVTCRAKRPLIVASMYGNTTPAVMRAKQRFEDAGFDVTIFHASGIGGQTMESLIDDGIAAACFDFTTTELIDYVAGGVMSAGPDRLMAAARKGIPTILVPGCIDQVVFYSVEQMPEKYRSRKLYQWNPNITLMRSNAEECRRVGEMIAHAANQHASGNIAILIPLGGTSMLDRPGGPYWEPEANRACFEAIKRLVKPSVPVYEVAAYINDPAFVDRAVEVFLNLLEREGLHPSLHEATTSA
jgi:uncharacterized protein (UPF0261 family)